jgi:SAM-dependent methyltransferase
MNDFSDKIDLYSGKELAQRKIWYSDAARSYDRTRPQYPQDKIDQLISLTSLTQNSRILEIGCGPATATVSFASIGCPIVCLEPNPNFYSLACHNCQSYPQIEIINTSLEEWQLETSRFDVVFSATAFHWIPAAIGYPKVAAALKDDGYFILLWNGQLLPNIKISQSLVEVYQKYAPNLAAYEDLKTQKESLYSLGKMLQDSGLFTVPSYEEVVIDVNYSIEDYLALLSTYSPYIALDSESRRALFLELREKLDRESGDCLQLSYISAFHLSQKIATSS